MNLLQPILGIIALTLALLSIYNPIFGIWTTLASAIFALFSAGKGFWLGIAAIVINLVNLLIFSSTMFIAPGFAIFAVFLILAQIATLVILVKRNTS
ncbi:hypothetical protein SPONL_1062 [uncultured Candidatus Thioglobus sp.]|nr:hypothetical protein SPONL_1062 [uncultured Candidatus Thioglobus sp.]